MPRKKIYIQPKPPCFKLEKGFKEMMDTNDMEIALSGWILLTDIPFQHEKDNKVPCLCGIGIYAKIYPIYHPIRDKLVFLGEDCLKSTGLKKILSTKTKPILKTKSDLNITVPRQIFDIDNYKDLSRYYYQTYMEKCEERVKRHYNNILKLEECYNLVRHLKNNSFAFKILTRINELYEIEGKRMRMKQRVAT